MTRNIILSYVGGAYTQDSQHILVKLYCTAEIPSISFCNHHSECALNETQDAVSPTAQTSEAPFEKATHNRLYNAIQSITCKSVRVLTRK